MDPAANLAIFLTERKGTPLAAWNGRLSAAEQRALFGRYLGKGTLWIDGSAETVEHTRQVCFGHDCEVTASIKWGAL